MNLAIPDSFLLLLLQDPLPEIRALALRSPRLGPQRILQPVVRDDFDMLEAFGLADLTVLAWNERFLRADAGLLTRFDILLHRCLRRDEMRDAVVDLLHVHAAVRSDPLRDLVCVVAEVADGAGVDLLEGLPHCYRSELW